LIFHHVARSPRKGPRRRRNSYSAVQM